MKLKRVALAAAAAVVGPTVLMATPAMAQDNPAVIVPDAEPKGDAGTAGEAATDTATPTAQTPAPAPTAPAPAPAAPATTAPAPAPAPAAAAQPKAEESEEESEESEESYEDIVDVEGPKTTILGLPAGGFKAGGDWQNLTVHLDNAGLGDLEDFLVSVHMGRGFDEGPWVETSHVRLQAYGEDEKGHEGWYDVELGGSEEVMGGDIGIVSIAAGDATDIKLRMKFTADTPAGAFHLVAGGYVPMDEESESNEFVSSYSDVYDTKIIAASNDNGGDEGDDDKGDDSETDGKGTDNAPKPNGGTKPITDTGSGTGTGTGSGTGTAPTGGQLAETGADAATSWALGGAGVALAMGAALVAGTGRHRRPSPTA
ncbi:hypothetical protein [Streptomyces bambusae]|uniref:LPXTG cell wall anchor domain-containing protein n=1 Tax=Streptomyces bambusae TaxID=1550616 RepID=A0ABS6ZCD9_9ACTN|nr:hypothetical protein [Streptomyces bambusae]MBW5485430.1 hypothetical protein [Streptomyces bambusae]